MTARRRPASPAGRAAAVLRRHFADPTFYAARVRAARGRAAPPMPPPRDGGASRLARLRARSLAWLIRRRARRGPPAAPGLLARWIDRPMVFVPALLLGTAAVAASFDTPRNAPFPSGLIPVGGAALAWMGLGGAWIYADRRWPRAERALTRTGLLLSLAAVAGGLALSGRAVGLALVQIGVWSTVAIVTAWLDRQAEGGDH